MNDYSYSLEKKTQYNNIVDVSKRKKSNMSNRKKKDYSHFPMTILFENNKNINSLVDAIVKDKKTLKDAKDDYAPINANQKYRKINAFNKSNNFKEASNNSLFSLSNNTNNKLTKNLYSINNKKKINIINYSKNSNNNNKINNIKEDNEYSHGSNKVNDINEFFDNIHNSKSLNNNISNSREINSTTQNNSNNSNNNKSKLNHLVPINNYKNRENIKNNNNKDIANKNIEFNNTFINRASNKDVRGLLKHSYSNNKSEKISDNSLLAYIIKLNNKDIDKTNNSNNIAKSNIKKLMNNSYYNNSYNIHRALIESITNNLKCTKIEFSDNKDNNKNKNLSMISSIDNKNTFIENHENTNNINNQYSVHYNTITNKNNKDISNIAKTNNNDDNINTIKTTKTYYTKLPTYSSINNNTYRSINNINGNYNAADKLNYPNTFSTNTIHRINKTTNDKYTTPHNIRSNRSLVSNNTISSNINNKNYYRIDNAGLSLNKSNNNLLRKSLFTFMAKKSDFESVIRNNTINNNHTNRTVNYKRNNISNGYNSDSVFNKLLNTINHSSMNYDNVKQLFDYTNKLRKEHLKQIKKIKDEILNSGNKYNTIDKNITYNNNANNNDFRSHRVNNSTNTYANANKPSNTISSHLYYKFNLNQSTLDLERKLKLINKNNKSIYLNKPAISSNNNVTNNDDFINISKNKHKPIYTQINTFRASPLEENIYKNNYKNQNIEKENPTNRDKDKDTYNERNLRISNSAVDINNKKSKCFCLYELYKEKDSKLIKENATSDSDKHDFLFNLSEIRNKVNRNNELIRMIDSDEDD